MPSETLVAPTWRLFDLVRTATTLLGSIAVLAGCSGRFLTLQPHRRVRARRLTLGGSVTLVCVVSLESVYRAISWVVAGGVDGLSPASAFLPTIAHSSGLYGASETAETLPLSAIGTVARTSAISGLSIVCLSVGLWAVSSADGPLRRSGVRGITLGVALLGISVGAELFAAINYALAAGWSS